MTRIAFLILTFAVTTGKGDSSTHEQAFEAVQATVQKLEMKVGAMAQDHALKRAHAEVQKLEAEVKAAAQALRQNMTLNEAVTSLSKRIHASPALASTLQELTHPQRHFRHSGRGSMFLGLENKEEPYESVGKAKTMINEMLTEVVHNIDKAHQDCKSIFEEKCQLMEFNRQDIDEMNAEYAAANAKIVEAEGHINFIEYIELPRLRDMLAENIKMCNEKIAELTSYLETTEHDITVINGVVNMTGCGEAVDRWHEKSFEFVNVASKTSLLKCYDCQGNATVKFQHPVLQQKLMTIKSESLRHQVQQALNSMVQKEVPFEVPPNPCDGVTYDDAAVSPPGGACSVETNPNCEKLLGKFLEIQVSMQELNVSLREQLAQTRADCDRVQRNLNAEIAQQTTLLLQHQAELAYATQTVQRVNMQSTMKRQEFDQFATEVDHLRTECSQNLRAYEAEKCQLEKIRSEIYIKIKGGIDNAMFVDCEMSEWVSSGCSVSCGGGTETQTRYIKVVPMKGGVSCPPYEAILPCNTHACPVDCEEEVWGHWSSCSAQCDGGIKLRTRKIITHPTRGGRPCEAVTETESCNMETCDPDCELWDWSAWSACSKACDTGHTQRVRDVQTPAKNMGKCPDEEDPERFDQMTCNDFPCFINEASVSSQIIEEAPKSPKCKAKADIVFLIDASGSLGQTGFDDSKKFAKAFANSFEGEDAQLSIIQFWGPVTWEDFYDCTDNIDANLTDAFLRDRCGINLVQQLSNDTNATLENIEGLQWPGETATTFTSGALLLAKEVLKFARPDVEHVVVTLTDGVPIDPSQTKAASKTVKAENVRLVFAGVGLDKSANNYIKSMATQNKNDNYVKIDELQGLHTIGPVNNLIEDVCGLDIYFYNYY